MILKRALPFLTLFSSFSTLICCALPALLVTLGLGASLASFLGSYPQLIWLSEHKIAVFVFAGAMRRATAFIRWHYQDLSCPSDPKLAKACQQTRVISALVFYGSVIIYCIGAFFAFIASKLIS
jgi:hypothetical protein